MKATLSVIMSRQDERSLNGLLFTDDGLENAAFAVCGYARTTQGTTLLVRKILAVPLEAYVERTAFHLEVSPAFINQVVDEAEGKLAILVMHSHPGGAYGRYSPSDDHGEARLFKVFEELVPGAPHASLLFTQGSVIGRTWEKGRFREVRRVKATGPELIELSRDGKSDSKGGEIMFYDRQVAAFGRQMQSRLSSMTVGIVGLGGTGSAVCEQLARIGVSGFVLIDPDRFEASNLSRTYGTERRDAKSRPFKVSVAHDNILRINPGAEIVAIQGTVVSQSTLEKLRDCDVVFGCTDTDWSRSVLNRFAYQYLVPVIDMGVRIVVGDGKIAAAGGRVSMIGPGLPCLWCTHHLDSERIRVESMSDRERTKLLREKYIKGLEVRAPSVISLNSTLASLAVTMLLSAISGLSEVPSSAPEHIYDVVDGTIFRSRGRPDQGCKVCGPDSIQGMGDLQVVSAYP